MQRRHIFFLITFFSLLQGAYSADYSSVVFRPVSEYVFTFENTTFEAIIYNEAPKNVRTTVQSLPDSVFFVSANTEEIIEEEQKGTLVQITLRFEKAGMYKLSPIAARIGWGSALLKFEPIEVYTNPATIEPVANLKIVAVEDISKTQFYVGQKIQAILSLKYFSDAISVSRDISQDFLCNETQWYKSLPLKTEGFSADEYLLVLYEFTPLKEGLLHLPEVKIHLRTCGLLDKTVSTTPLEINIINAPTTEDSVFEDSLPDYVYSPSGKQETKSISKEPLSSEEIQQIVKIETQKKSKLKLCFNIFLALSFFLGVLWLLIIFVTKKRKNTLLFFVISSFIIAFVFYFLYIPTYGIILDQKIHSIPDDKSLQSFSVTIGSKVKIHNIIDDWVFISSEEKIKGWMPLAKIIVIK